MTETKPNSFSDIVDRAAAELRSTPVPPGPPPELLEALLHAADAETGGAICALGAPARTCSDASYSQPLALFQKTRNIIMKRPYKSLTTLAACCVAVIAAYLIF